MGRKYAVGLVFFACLVSLGLWQGNQGQAITTVTGGTILSGTCSAGGLQIGVAAPVFLLGQYANQSCTAVQGPPTRGIPMPDAGTLMNLYVTDDAKNQGSVVLVYVNGLSTALTCTEGPSGKCSDTTHKIKVVAADEVAATYTSTSGNGGAFISLLKK